MATASSVIDQVLRRLEESVSSPKFYSRSEILQHLNDGLLELTLIGAQLTSEQTHVLIGAKQQGLPEGAIAVIHVAYADVKIEKTSIEQFDRNNANWDAQSGILKNWAPCGLNQWFCDRHPTSTENVKLTTLDQPATLTENSTIDLDAEYIEALEDYCFHAVRFKEGGLEFEQAMPEYDSFRKLAGFVARRTFSEQWTVWNRDPNADTGLAYSTLERS